MKTFSLMVLGAAVSVMASTAFADITAICNPSKGFSVDQQNAGIPGTILATIMTSTKDFAGSKMSFDLKEGLKQITPVDFENPDENMVSADYTVTGKDGKAVKYEVMFYIGGANDADLYQTDPSGNRIDSTSVDYQCGMYDDGNFGSN